MYNRTTPISRVGACGGNLECATCHVSIKEQKTLSEPTEEELDMLDYAVSRTDASRLACQIKVTADMDGLCIQIPS